MEKFRAQQEIPEKTVEEVFSFFSDEKNLERITPPWLNFKVTGKTTENIQKGTKIQYQLRIHGFPCRWESLIEEWVENKMFIDLQTKGPYSHWRHVHSFEKKGSNVLIIDEIEYKISFGFVGRVFAGRFIARDIKKIFDYRSNKILDLLKGKIKE